MIGSQVVNVRFTIGRYSIDNPVDSIRLVGTWSMVVKSSVGRMNVGVSILNKQTNEGGEEKVFPMKHVANGIPNESPIAGTTIQTND